MVLFQMLTPPKACPVSCFDMPESTGVIQQWAIGQGQFTFPPGTALALGGGSSSTAASLAMG